MGSTPEASRARRIVVDGDFSIDGELSALEDTFARRLGVLRHIIARHLLPPTAADAHIP